MKAVGVLLAALAAGALWAQSPVVVSGQVTDAATGLPIEDATVSIADQLRYTDSAGHYMLDPVAPGSAEVRVEAKGYLDLAKTDPDAAKVSIATDQAVHNFRLVPAASIIGKISAPDAEWRRAGFLLYLLQEDFTDGVRRFTAPTLTGHPIPTYAAGTGTEGEFEFRGLAPGRYVLYAAPPLGSRLFFARDQNGNAVIQHPDEGYVQTFFPGTGDFAAAIPIAVASGETRTADFTLIKRQFYSVSGQVDGTLDGPGWMIQIGRTGEGVSQENYSGKITDGKFLVEGLPPGSYQIQQISTPPKIEPSPRGGGIQMQFAMRRVNGLFSITDHDVIDLHLTLLSPPAGPISTNGQFRLASDGALPGRLSVQFADPYPGGESTPIAASPDGVFWLAGGPGEYSVRPLVSPAFAVTEIRYGSGNYLNSLIPLEGDASLTITLSDQPASVSGTLTDSDGKPVPAKVVLLPDPIPSDFDFRAIRVTATNDRGGFLFGGLAPGRYKALALTGDDRRQDHDMTLIGPRLGMADTFELRAGQNLTINLQP